MGKVRDDGGIPCPTCGKRSMVVETRRVAAGLRRRRRCSDLACEGKFSTIELAAPATRMTDRRFAIVEVAQLERLVALAAALRAGS